MSSPKAPFIGARRPGDLASGSGASRPEWYFTSSVGVKVLMAITGLCLFLFLVFHLAGNLLLFFGPATLNEYSNWLIVNPLLVPTEIGLLAIFVIHVSEAALNWARNRRAKPIGLYQSYRRIFGYGWAGKPSRKSVASSTMILTGLITLIFVVVHLVQFKYGPYYPVTSPANGAPGIRDLYLLDIQNFSNGAIVIFYVFCLGVIGFHLWHGLSSALNSLGVDYPGSTPTVLRVGRVLAVLVAGAFIAIPLWVFFFRA